MASKHQYKCQFCGKPLVGYQNKVRHEKNCSLRTSMENATNVADTPLPGTDKLTDTIGTGNAGAVQVIEEHIDHINATGDDPVTGGNDQQINPVRVDDPELIKDADITAMLRPPADAEDSGLTERAERYLQRMADKGWATWELGATKQLNDALVNINREEKALHEQTELFKKEREQLPVLVETAVKNILLERMNAAQGGAPPGNNGHDAVAPANIGQEVLPPLGSALAPGQPPAPGMGALSSFLGKLDWPTIGLAFLKAQLPPGTKTDTISDIAAALIGKMAVKPATPPQADIKWLSRGAKDAIAVLRMKNIDRLKVAESAIANANTLLGQNISTGHRSYYTGQISVLQTFIDSLAQHGGAAGDDIIRSLSAPREL